VVKSLALIGAGPAVLVRTQYFGIKSGKPTETASDVLFGATTPAVRALMQATTTIPIISTAADPLESGLVKSLARPEGNVTGISTITFDLVAKRVELLKQLVPRLSRLAFIWHTKTGRQVRLKYSAQLRKQSRTSLGRAW
jgi:ABC-type uncharacterized transport system substrate-binding protein